MNKLVIPVSPLTFNQFTRDYWGQYDATVAAQLAALADDPCYSIKFYKAPADNEELFAAFDYNTYGLRVTPGSLLYGFFLPAIVNTATPTASVPGQFTVQIRDISLEHDFFDEPCSSILLANFKPTYQTQVAGASAPAGYLNMGSFPNLWCAAHPVTGTGQFDVKIQETSGAQQRIELVIGCLEVCE